MSKVKDQKMKVVGLTNYLIDLHSAEKSVVFILAIALAVGFLGAIALNGLNAQSLLTGLYTGIFLVALPAIASGFLTTWISLATKKEMNYRRSFYLAFFNSLILSALYLIGAFMPNKIYGLFDMLAYGYVLIMITRAAIMKITYPYSITQSIVLGSIQPLLGYLAILNVGLLFPGLVIGLHLLLLKIVISLAIFLAGVALFVLLVNAPMKRSFGINTFEVASAFLENWFDQSNTIEQVLKRIGEKADILVGLISFRAKKKIKTLMIIPYIHPGPFGEVGGGRMTRILMDRLEKGMSLFIPHGTATHDLNPVTIASLNLIAERIKRSLAEIKYYKTASHSLRIQKGDAKIIGQRFGSSLFMASTFSPKATEDIDFSIGLAIMNLLETGYGDVIYADCHNCHRPGFHAIFSGNPIMFDLIDGVKMLNARMKKEKDYQIKMGIGIDPMTEYSSIDGVGPMGVRVTVVESNGQKTAYVLFDANNIVAGIREKIIAEIKKLGIDMVEVMTTDSHCVNNIRGVENPLGMRIEKEVLVKRAVDATYFAITDLEPVEVGTRIIKVKGIDVLGPQKSIELVSMINTMTAMMKIFAPLISMASLSLSLLAVFLVGW